jgi:hypothetical protein
MATAVAPSSRSHGNQRAPSVSGIDRHLDESQWKRAAVEPMSRRTTARREFLVAIQWPPCWNQLVDRASMQIALLVAEQVGGGTIARCDETMLVDQYCRRRPTRQRQLHDRSIRSLFFPSLVVTVPVWRLLPRLATTAIRPNGFHRSPLRA